jgi:hypothetical protein
VRADLAQEAIDAARSAAEWPYYGKFAYVESVDLAIVGAQNRWHGDLLRLIREHVAAISGAPFTLRDQDVFLGIVEWEDDGSMRLRTMSAPGNRGLPQFVESDLLALLKL